MNSKKRDGISNVIRELESETASNVKKNRMLSLDDRQYRRLKAVCIDRGWVISHVIDKLIAEFLADIEK